MGLGILGCSLERLGGSIDKKSYEMEVVFL